MNVSAPVSAYTQTPVTANSSYSVVIRTFDTDVDLFGVNSEALTCKTPLGIPEQPQDLSAVNTNQTSLRILWDPPNVRDGIDGYHVVVGDATITGSGERTQCEDLWQETVRVTNRFSYTTSDSTETLFIVNVTTWFAGVDTSADATDSSNNPEVLFCVRSFNHDLQSQWANGSMTARSLVRGALAGPGGGVNPNPPSPHLIILIVIVLLSIIAAVSIAVILAIALYIRRDKPLIPKGDYCDDVATNTSTSSQPGLTDKSFKRTRTPQRLASNASTRPMVIPEEDAMNEIYDIQGVDSDSSQSKGNDGGIIG